VERVLALGEGKKEGRDLPLSREGFLRPNSFPEAVYEFPVKNKIPVENKSAFTKDAPLR
jgi:hypothetical protein